MITNKHHERERDREHKRETSYNCTYLILINNTLIGKMIYTCIHDIHMHYAMHGDMRKLSNNTNNKKKKKLVIIKLDIC